MSVMVQERQLVPKMKHQEMLCLPSAAYRITQPTTMRIKCAGSVLGSVEFSTLAMGGSLTRSI